MKYVAAFMKPRCKRQPARWHLVATDFPRARFVCSN